MGNKFYTLVTALFLTCLLSARGQDSSYCNPYFHVTSNQGNVTFNAFDTLPHIQHAWYFGDGGYLNFSSNYAVVQHNYSSSGTYAVRHIIRDSLGGGCFDSLVQMVTVSTAPVCPFYIGQSVDSISSPRIYNFYAYPTGAGDTVRWSINGTLVATGDSLLNRSFSPGYYAICAQLQTAAGCNSVACTAFYVSSDTASSDTTTHVPPAPVDTCSISFTYTLNPSQTNQVHFHAMDSTGRDSLTWVVSWSSDTAHTVILHGADPVHIFPDTGCYRIVLFATSDSGCQSSSQQWICIDSLPGNNFIASYPNPSISQSNLDLKLDEGHTIYVSIFNSMGHLVLSKKQAGNNGLNHITLPVAGLPTGIYYVQIQYGGVTKRSKIQKL